MVRSRCQRDYVKHLRGGKRPCMVAFLLSLREGIEAALIVSILLGTLRRTEAPRSAARPVWLGVGAALAASLGLAALLGAVGADFEGRGQQIFEGIVVLLAGDVFPGELIEDWIKAKRDEHNRVQTRPHPYEVQLYFDL